MVVAWGSTGSKEDWYALQLALSSTIVQPMLAKSPSKSLGNSFSVLMAVAMPQPLPGMNTGDAKDMGNI